MPRVSVIVPARNAENTLPRTLDALAAQELGQSFEVIVVDDGSIDNTRWLAQARPEVRVVSQPPSGPAAARNRGVAEAGGAMLAFCDADVFPTPGWLDAGLRALGDAQLVQGRVLPDPGAKLGPFDRSLWVLGTEGLWQTANLFVTRAVFDRIGGFEAWITPRLGKAIAEDVWFGYRAVRAGARTAFSEQALAYHAVERRGPAAYVAERVRLWYFPAIMAHMPDLRSEFLHLHLFLNHRTAALDMAAVGCGLARRRSSLLPLVGALPYCMALRAHSKRSWPAGPRASLVGCVDLMADLVGLLALAGGSLRYRSAVL